MKGTDLGIPVLLIVNLYKERVEPLRVKRDCLRIEKNK